MKDFTIKTYYSLLKKTIEQNFTFIPFSSFLKEYSSNSCTNSFIILRHDVDRLPYNSLLTAKIENELNIKGTYYFRIIPKSLDLNVINQIIDLGHEIGYHYEDVDLVLKIRKLNFRSTKGYINNNR